MQLLRKNNFFQNKSFESQGNRTILRTKYHLWTTSCDLYNSVTSACLLLIITVGKNPRLFRLVWTGWLTSFLNALQHYSGAPEHKFLKQADGFVSFFTSILDTSLVAKLEWVVWHPGKYMSNSNPFEPRQTPFSLYISLSALILIKAINVIPKIE